MKMPGPFVKDEEELIYVVIETPRDSRNKYAYDPETEMFELTTTLPAGTSFPLEFGFIPGTKAEDGDPIDVLVLMEQPAYPGCLVKCRLIGVIKGEQQDKKGDKPERNDRLVAIPDKSIDYKEIMDIKSLGKDRVQQITTFFSYYHEMSGGTFEPVGTNGPKEAMRMVKKACI